ncbi:hypothetical protein [Microbacterium sp. T32]|uniref:hypothetical protein n=1 Tax=Microbacterium sp. T32 TaxID=1776083 RepID=UPI000AE618B1|nr:hypothetical protein [Microbacterium sp. T32]
MSDLTTAELATRLAITPRHAVDLLARGDIEGRRLSTGVWLADLNSVLRYESAARRGKGRTLDSATAWGLLWELSGLRAGWLAPRTRARVRARLRDADVEDLARAVSGRTRPHRFRAANAPKAMGDLIATGAAVAGRLGVGLMDDTRRVSGYVRGGDVSAYAEAHFMAASTSGHDLIYENTLPIAYDGDAMPGAVIAADLATSVDTRERSGGLRAIADLRAAWLDAQ